MGGKKTDTTTKTYELLLDSWGFTEWTRVGKHLVYKNANGIRAQLSQLFAPLRTNRDPLTEHSINSWFHNDCAIKFGAQKDRELTGNPLCFGEIVVMGRAEKVDEVDKILNNTFKELEEDRPHWINNW